MYTDCTHFCAVVIKFRDAPAEIHDESISQSYFILTYDGGEIRLPTGENFSSTSLLKLNEIADAVNCLIATSLEERQDLNINLQPALHVAGMTVASGYYVTDLGEHDQVQEARTVSEAIPLILTADGISCEEVGEAVPYHTINRD
jgi:predicted nucleic acid-binding Zn ribbon protein